MGEKITITNDEPRDRSEEVVTAIPLAPEQWAAIGRLHGALSLAIRHPWSLEAFAHVSGRPMLRLHVLAPAKDTFRYDDAVRATFESFMPPGYFDDGLSHDCEARDDGLREREYFLCPTKREEAAA